MQVDVRDHEKLCGEPIECKCGLKFAFKCNLVAHKKAHPSCQEMINQPQQPTSNLYSPAYSSGHNNQSTSTSDEDSSQSRENSMSPPIQQPRATTKRRHHSFTHETSRTKRQRPKDTRYYTLTLTPPPSPSPSPPLTLQLEPQNPGEVSRPPPTPHTQFYTLTPPAPEFKGQPKVDYASSTFKAAFYDFAGIQFSTQGTSPWTHNLHYPSATSLPSTIYTSVFGGLQPLPRSQFSRHQIPQVQTHDSATRVQSTNTGSNLPVWSSFSGVGLRF